MQLDTDTTIPKILIFGSASREYQLENILEAPFQDFFLMYTVFILGVLFKRTSCFLYDVLNTFFCAITLRYPTPGVFFLRSATLTAPAPTHLAHHRAHRIIASPLLSAPVALSG